MTSFTVLLAVPDRVRCNLAAGTFLEPAVPAALIPGCDPHRHLCVSQCCRCAGPRPAGNPVGVSRHLASCVWNPVSSYCGRVRGWSRLAVLLTPSVSLPLLAWSESDCLGARRFVESTTEWLLALWDHFTKSQAIFNLQSLTSCCLKAARCLWAWRVFVF